MGHVDNVVFSTCTGAIFEGNGPIWAILGVIGTLKSGKWLV